MLCILICKVLFELNSLPLRNLSLPPHHSVGVPSRQVPLLSASVSPEFTIKTLCYHGFQYCMDPSTLSGFFWGIQG